MSYLRPPASGAALRLHMNENTAGCSPAVIAALRAVESADAAFYPDYDATIAACEEWFGVAPGRLLLTNGLDEGLHLAALWAARHQDGSGRPAVVVVEPAFEMYAANAESAGLEIARVASGPDFAFPLDAVLAAVTDATRLVYLTDPNNPTGSALPSGAAGRIAAAAPHALVLVDEAYADYSGRTLIGPALDRARNLVVGRTFSKAHGLAALRAGALVAHPDAIAAVGALQAPFSVNGLACVALRAALADRPWVEWCVAQARESRELIHAFCRDRGLRAWPSEANFVLVRIGPDAPAVVSALAARGVAIRDRSTAPGCAGCVRITAGLVEHTRVCLDALEDVLAARDH